jgi:hypothetical protein
MSINLSTLVNQTNPLQLAKAWVNFNGTTATPSTIRSSYNVSSVTKNGTGDYTVNFATPMADANYSVSGIVQGISGQAGISIMIKESTTPLISSFNVVCRYGNNASNFDNPMIFLQIFGN